MAQRSFPVKDNNLVLEADDRLFKFRVDSAEFAPLSSQDGGAHFRILGQWKEAGLCLQELDPALPDTGYRLEITDGSQFHRLPNSPTNTLLGKKLSAFYAARNGDLWLAGELGTAVYRDGKWTSFVSSGGTVPEAPFCFIELADARLWCATSDKIWEFDGRTECAVRSGFDRINDMAQAHDGTVWVASNNGIYRFKQETWLQNGTEEGLPGLAVREVCDQQGRVWAGTTHGLTFYNPNASSTDHDPPQTHVQPLRDNQKNIPEGGTLSLTFSALDKWKYTPQNRLLYSYRLDERDRTPFQEANTVALSDLSPGKHYFQVRAMDRNCNIEDPKTARVEFSVVLPWFKEPRLLSIAVAGLAFALFFAGLAFNRHLRLMRSYAEVEGKVAQRTHELEAANRELLHSQKMTALGTLAAGVAHDFNNILSIIKGSAQIIEENLKNPEKVHTRVERIKTVVEQGSGIVKAMLGFSRDSPQQPEPWDINAVVDDTIKLLGDRFLREVEVGFQSSKGTFLESRPPAISFSRFCSTSFSMPGKP